MLLRWKYDKTAAILGFTHWFYNINTTNRSFNTIKTFIFMMISGGGGVMITDAEIKALSETLYILDSNKASASELVVDPQVLVPDSETNSQTDLSSQL